jgi:protein-tyrosine-phosphatase
MILINIKRGKMNILFVCKYNRFRSKVAEEYFNQINKNKNIRVYSGGILSGHYPLNAREVEVAKANGIRLAGKPKGIPTDLLRTIDLIIIVANNVPESIFNYEYYNGKIIVWNVTDLFSGESKVLIERRINEIKRKVEKLVKRLENKK